MADCVNIHSVIRDLSSAMFILVQKGENTDNVDYKKGDFYIKKYHTTWF